MKKLLIALNIFIIVIMIFTVISDAVSLNEVDEIKRFTEQEYVDETSSFISGWLGAALVIAQLVAVFSAVTTVVVTFLRYICCKDPIKKKKLKRSLKIAIILGIILFIAAMAIGVFRTLASGCGDPLSD